MNEKAYTVRVMPAFVADMRAIRDYISFDLQNPEAAERLTADVRKAIEVRAEAPLAFEPYHSKKERRYAYYRILVRNYLILYVVADDVMEIRRILYNRRDWKNQV